MKEILPEDVQDIIVEASGFSGYNNRNGVMWASHKGGTWAFSPLRNHFDTSYSVTPRDLMLALFGSCDHWVNIKHQDLVVDRGSVIKLITSTFVCGGLPLSNKRISETLDSMRAAIESNLLQVFPADHYQMDGLMTVYTSINVPGYAFGLSVDGSGDEFWQIVNLSQQHFVNFSRRANHLN